MKKQERISENKKIKIKQLNSNMKISKRKPKKDNKILIKEIKSNIKIKEIETPLEETLSEENLLGETLPEIKEKIKIRKKAFMSIFQPKTDFSPTLNPKQIIQPQHALEEIAETSQQSNNKLNLFLQIMQKILNLKI